MSKMPPRPARPTPNSTSPSRPTTILHEVDDRPIPAYDEKLGRALLGSNLSTQGKLQLLRAQVITDLKDREALLEMIAIHQWWATLDQLHSEHVLRATLLKYGMSAVAAQQIIQKKIITNPKDREALLVFFSNYLPDTTHGGGRVGVKKGKGGR